MLKNAKFGMKRGIRVISNSCRRCFSSYSTTFSPLIGLNSKEKTLYEEAEQFALTHLHPQAVDRDEHSLFSRDLFLELGKQGYGGMLVSKDQGGMGLNRREALCIIEVTPYIHSYNLINITHLLVYR
ncbi:acyl-CoA dehydrogenase family protein [archaeon]|nr:MAG: acyl-CoA dehydrogenase family protein [archaeon]